MNKAQRFVISVVATLTCVALTCSHAALQKNDEETHSRLKQLGVALMSYAQDYDDILPPIKSATMLEELLRPYVDEESVFISPADNKPFLPNPYLSGRSLNAIFKEGFEKKQGLVAFYEATTRADNTRFVLKMAKPYSYLNGEPVWAYTGAAPTYWLPTVEKLSQSQWREAKKASHIR